MRHRQNIFVRVFSCTWISSPITGSHSATQRHLLRLPQRGLDRVAHLDVPEPVLEGAPPLDQPELALAGLELQLQLAELYRSRAVEDAGALPEHTLDRR